MMTSPFVQIAAHPLLNLHLSPPFRCSSLNLFYSLRQFCTCKKVKRSSDRGICIGYIYNVFGLGHIL